jgi:hypothetical protein
MQFAMPAKLKKCLLQPAFAAARQINVADEKEAPEIFGYHRKKNDNNAWHF